MPAKAACDELGLTVESVFIPLSQSRNSKQKEKSLNWKITLKFNGKPILSTDYNAGIGYCPSYKQGNNNTIYQQESLAWECEKGTKYNGKTYFPPMGGKPILPNPLNVIACLVLDASTLDYACFEDWASDLGYGTDSRAAESTYRACLETALKLRNSLGEKNLNKLKEVFSNY